MKKATLLRLIDDFRMLDCILLICTEFPKSKRRPNSRRRWLELGGDDLKLRARNAVPSDFHTPITVRTVEYEHPHGHQGIKRVRLFFGYHTGNNIGILEITPSHDGKFRLKDIVAQIKQGFFLGTIDYALVICQSFHRNSNQHPYELGITEGTIIRPTPDVNFNKLFYPV